jgi:2-octaprenylphenol hydroxylase
MSDQIVEFDVVIVGAGIAGAALALALDGSGIKVLLLEAGDFIKEPVELPADVNGFDARVSAITLESQAFLERLGVWQQIIGQVSQKFSHMTVWDGEGTAGLIDFDAGEISEQHLGAIVPNRAIIQALLDKLDMSSNVKMVEQMRLSGLHKSQEGYRFSLGDKVVETQLLVGADGANSFVRQQLDFRTREWDYEHEAIVCTVETENSHQDTAWQCFHHHGPVALLPLPDVNGKHFCSIVWSQEYSRADNLLLLEDEDFAKALGLEIEHCLGKIKAVSKRFSFPLRQRHAVDYVKRSAALVGDAAHTIHPLAGQGINLGLKDVKVLAEELRKGHDEGTHLGEPQLLSRYQRRRKADNLAMMAIMEGFKRLFGQRSKVVGLLRNKGMQFISGVGPLKQQIIKHAVGR